MLPSVTLTFLGLCEEKGVVSQLPAFNLRYTLYARIFTKYSLHDRLLSKSYQHYIAQIFLLKIIGLLLVPGILLFIFTRRNGRHN